MNRLSFALALAAALALTPHAQELAGGEAHVLASVRAAGGGLADVGPASRTQAVLEALVAGDREPLFAAAPDRHAERARADWGQILDRFEQQGAPAAVRLLGAEVRPDGKAVVQACVVFGQTEETLRLIWSAGGHLRMLTRGVARDC